MKTVLVTGSSRGIGRGIALELARQGYGLVLHGRAPGNALAESLEAIRATGAPCRSVTFDVADRAATRTALLEDMEVHGGYYGVVLNAGVTRDNAFPFLGDDDWDQVLGIDLHSFYNVLKPVVEPMLLARQGGRIVVMSSVAGILGNRGQVNYSAAKAGLIGAARALGAELGRRGITVNCIAPGLIETDMSENAPREKILPLIPMRRTGSVAEVAGLAAFLMSDQAAYITRQVIAVDGGLS